MTFTTSAILEGHTDEVWTISWSPNGKYLASGSQDKSAIIWERRDTTGSERGWSVLYRLTGFEHAVSSVAWSPTDSCMLATCSESIIKIWNAETGELIDCLPQTEELIDNLPQTEELIDNLPQTGELIDTAYHHNQTITSLLWLPDGVHLVSGGLDGRIIVWNTAERTNDIFKTVDFPVVTDLAFSSSPDLNHFLVFGKGPLITCSHGSLSRQNKMVIFQVDSEMGTESIVDRSEILGLGVDVTNAAVSTDSQVLITSTKQIMLWDIQSNHTAKTYSGHEQTRHVIRSCFGGTNQSLVLSGSEDGYVYVWNRENSQLISRLPGHGDGTVNCVACNPADGDEFASCSDDGTVRIWHA